jgi:hypothetical protein
MQDHHSIYALQGKNVIGSLCALHDKDGKMESEAYFREPWSFSDA